LPAAFKTRRPGLGDNAAMPYRSRPILAAPPIQRRRAAEPR